MNSTWLINDSRTLVDQEPKLWCINGRSYYRWIMLLVQQKWVMVDYTQGHSDGLMVPSKLNAEADYYATSAQKVAHYVPTALLLTWLHILLHTGWLDWIQHMGFHGTGCCQICCGEVMDQQQSQDGHMAIQPHTTSWLPIHKSHISILNTGTTLHSLRTAGNGRNLIQKGKVRRK